MRNLTSLPGKSTPLEARPETFGSCVERLRHRWGWFLALGSLMALLGVAALVLLVSATIASVYTIAVFLIVAGGAEIVLGFSSRSWSRFFLWVIGGLAYIVVGAFALAQPFIAAAFFTLLLGAGMLATGIIRIYTAIHLGKNIRSSALLAGIVTAIVGLLILFAWPTNSFVILGILLGADLMIWGASWISLGLRMRAHAKALAAHS
ncbi:MAG TPA: HdeD family acid-resistance protein [Methylovirgula sp.]|nr:HdeD family acid-resistance protein [Methylovirgula sp.]